MVPKKLVRLLVALALPLLLAAGRPTPTWSDGPASESQSAVQAEQQAARDRIAQLAALKSHGEASIVRIQSDPVFPGRRHLRYDQRISGVRVFGAQLVEQQDAEGRTLTVFGHVQEPPQSPDVVPNLSADQAVRVALGVFPTGGRGVGDPELVLLPHEGRLLLAWMAYVRFDQHLERVFVDAKTGVIAYHYSDLHTAATAGLGTGVWNDSKKLSVDSTQGSYRARDRLRPPMILTYDMKGDASATNWILYTGAFNDGSLASDSDNNWTDGAVVDAHVYAGLTYDYYYKRHGRRGLDNADMPIRSVTHVQSTPWANAFWDPYSNAMYYGDGGYGYAAFSSALDVVAHELTHGVTSFTWNGIYQNESGALNEAFSDVMGTAVEFMWQPAGNGRLQADYYMGEDLSLLFSPATMSIRSMENPALFGDPDHYSVRYVGTDDNGGVHINSGIANQAFYLLAEGGVNRTSGQSVAGLGQDGRQKAERIFYRAFTSYLTPSATFHDARVATIQAASDLYGTAEAAQVAATWSAVGVE